MTPEDFGALWLSFKLGAVTTAVLLVIGTPIALWLSRSRSILRPVVEAITALPLVLPPTVLGFYLLLLFSPLSPFGSTWVQVTGSSLAFSFTGLVIASVIYSLPFMVQPLSAAFSAVGSKPLEAAASLRAGPFDRFLTVLSPLALRGYLTAAVLTFAHTIGEFGVVLMIGGGIPGRTRVVSVAIYENVETQRFADAHALSLVLIAFSFLILVAVYSLNRKFPVSVGHS